MVSDLLNGRPRAARHLALVAGAVEVSGCLRALGMALRQPGAYRQCLGGTTLGDPRLFEEGLSPLVPIWIERRAHE